MGDHEPKLRQQRQQRQLHTVSTDQPGLVLHRPVRKLRQIIVLYTLLPLIFAGLAGYVGAKVAFERGAAHTDQRIAVLESDLAERRKANAEANAARDAKIAQLNRLVCILADHAQPRDDQVAQVRGEFGCNGGPYPVPHLPGETPQPNGTTSPTPRSTPRVTPSGRRTSGPPRAGPTKVVPQPAPTPPRPGPVPSGDPVCIDLPLLPKICL